MNVTSILSWQRVRALMAIAVAAAVAAQTHAACPTVCCPFCNTGQDGPFPVDSDFFGESIALDGDIAVVGARGRDFDEVDDAGAAYVYDLDQATTVPLQASNAEENDQFGTAVAISGTLVIVGAPLKAISSMDNVGRAYVFDGDDEWNESILAASNGAEGDEFGFSVAIDGAVAVIGARGVGDLVGAAYIFELDGTWEEVGVLTADDAFANDDFGRSVSISGDVIVVGAAGVDNDTGAAYVFEKPGTGWKTMTETAVLTASDGVDDDLFGLSVSISGDRIVVGSPACDKAYVFDKPGGGWATATEDDQFQPCGAAGAVDFGWSVSVDGDTVVVGARRGNPDTGTAFLFGHFSGGSGWEFRRLLAAQDGATLDLFGTSVAIGSGRAVVGAPFHTEEVDSGAFYEFEGLTCDGDSDDNGVVDVVDLLDVLGQWGTDPGGPPDFDDNGDVDTIDLLLVLGRWGSCICGQTGDSLEDAVEDAGLTMNDWDEFQDTVTDPEVSEAVKENYVCWMEHYMDCHRQPYCYESSGICPDDDPFGGH